MATHSSILTWRIPWTAVHGVTKSWAQLSNFHTAGTEIHLWASPGRVTLPLTLPAPCPSITQSS